MLQKGKIDRRRYFQVEEGEWTEARKNGDLVQCCDCGLVHRIDYRIKTTGRGDEIEVRFRRDDRATKGIRKRSGISVVRLKP